MNIYSYIEIREKNIKNRLIAIDVPGYVNVHPEDVVVVVVVEVVDSPLFSLVVGDPSVVVFEGVVVPEGVVSDPWVVVVPLS